MAIRFGPLLLILAVLLPATARAQMLGDLVDTPTALETVEAGIAGKTWQSTLRSEGPGFAYTGIAVQGRTADPDATVQARFLGQSGAEWRNLHVVRSATTDLFIAGFFGEKPLPAGPFEIRFTSSAAFPVFGAEAGTFDTRTDSDRQIPAGEDLSPLPSAASGSIIPPPLITRADWGAEPFRGTPSRLANPSYDYLTFHHAAGYTAETREEGVLQMQAIQDLHQNVRGWSDVGYQFVIDRGGNLYQGRPFLSSAGSLDDLPVLALGAHVGGANTGNIGVSLLGCYHPDAGSYCEQEITPEAWETYVTLFAFLSERYGVSLSRVRGHRDFSSTACPGDNNYVLLSELQSQAADLIVSGNAPLGVASLEASIDESGVIQLAWSFDADAGIAAYRIERWFDGDRTVVFAGMGAEAASFADGAATEPGSLQYRLYAIGADGREQRLASADISLRQPGAYLLASVFPNPVSGEALLRYSLRADGVVALEVFDSLGRLVMQVDEGLKSADAWHAVELPGAKLPGGTYFARLVVSGFGGTVYEKTRPFTVAR